MSYIYIYNPEDVDVQVNYLGEMFGIKAKETKEFKEEVGRHFIYIYGFLQEVEEPKKVVKEVIKEEVITKKK